MISSGDFVFSLTWFGELPGGRESPGAAVAPGASTLAPQRVTSTPVCPEGLLCLTVPAAAVAVRPPTADATSGPLTAAPLSGTLRPSFRLRFSIVGTLLTAGGVCEGLVAESLDCQTIYT